jgi:hypothetical protein
LDPATPRARRGASIPRPATVPVAPDGPCEPLLTPGPPQGASCKLLRASHDVSVRSAASGAAAEDAARVLAAGGEASDISLHSTESEIGPDFNDDSADSSPSDDWDLLLQQRPRRQQQQARGAPLPPGLEEHAAAEPDFAPRYYLGTKLPVDGWFQACRGCGERTSRTADVSGADIPMCPRSAPAAALDPSPAPRRPLPPHPHPPTPCYPGLRTATQPLRSRQTLPPCRRCQTKFRSMQAGDYPPNATPGVEAYEPLYFWVPNLVPSLPKLTADAVSWPAGRHACCRRWPPPGARQPAALLTRACMPALMARLGLAWQLGPSPAPGSAAN